MQRHVKFQQGMKNRRLEASRPTFIIVCPSLLHRPSTLTSAAAPHYQLTSQALPASWQWEQPLHTCTQMGALQHEPSSSAETSQQANRYFWGHCISKVALEQGALDGSLHSAAEAVSCTNAATPLA